MLNIPSLSTPPESEALSGPPLLDGNQDVSLISWPTRDVVDWIYRSEIELETRFSFRDETARKEL